MDRTVLITSVGSGVGCAILDALRLAEGYRAVGLNTTDSCAGFHLCARAYLAPPSADEAAFAERLLAVAEAERPGLVLAGRDADVPVLARLAPELAERGAAVCITRPEAALACLDKLRTAEILHAARLPFAPTAHGVEETARLAREHGWPLLAKPRQGNASQGVRVLFAPEELAPYASDEAYLVQPLLIPWDAACAAGRPAPESLAVEGRPVQRGEYSIQALLGPDGTILGQFASRNDLVHGMPVRIEPVRDETLDAICRRAFAALAAEGVAGPCNLQAVRTGEADYVFFEANARFTGITGTRAAMGFREVEAAYRLFADKAPAAEAAALLRAEGARTAYRRMTDVLAPPAAEGEDAWQPSS